MLALNNYKKVCISVLLVSLLLAIDGIARPANSSKQERHVSSKPSVSRESATQTRNFSPQTKSFTEKPIISGVRDRSSATSSLYAPTKSSFTASRLSKSTPKLSRSTPTVSTSKPRLSISMPRSNTYTSRSRTYTPRESISMPRLSTSTPRVSTFTSREIASKSRRSTTRTQPFIGKSPYTGNVGISNHDRATSLSTRRLTTGRKSIRIDSIRTERVFKNPAQSFARTDNLKDAARSDSHLRETGRRPTGSRIYTSKKSHVVTSRKPRGFSSDHRYVYKDRDHHLHRINTSPRDRFSIRYSFGNRFTFSYIYPYYHRRYVFVSLGGFWPTDYTYYRYYQYGWYPYSWYGYYPVAYQAGGDTYNYYTYNSPTYEPIPTSPQTGYDDFSDVREKLAQQQAQPPADQTTVDLLFDSGVKNFEQGDYDSAVESFGQASKLAYEDIVVPFAYIQALFANEKYSEAAIALRVALSKVTPQKEGVFYPRGLYIDDQVLFDQIDDLAQQADLHSFDDDLQLLLGYQLFGIGEVENAVDHLQRARLGDENMLAADTLLTIIEKNRLDDIKTDGTPEN